MPADVYMTRELNTSDYMTLYVSVAMETLFSGANAKTDW
jgi:hypothetical protein